MEEVIITNPATQVIMDSAGHIVSLLDDKGNEVSVRSELPRRIAEFPEDYNKLCEFFDGSTLITTARLIGYDDSDDSYISDHYEGQYYATNTCIVVGEE